jgi:uncharacterized protein (TIGR03086 family)
MADMDQDVEQVDLLEYSLAELQNQVAALDVAELDVISNCDPWTVRQLASHALNNQLLWAGLVTGQQTVSAEDTMSGVPVEGDLAPFAEDACKASLVMWRTPGVLDASHVTPFGELPGSVVINFAIVDALCHAWDLGASVGRPIEFSTGRIPAVAGVVEATCTDAVRELGLIKAVPEVPAAATDTERLMAQAGRSLER